MNFTNKIILFSVISVLLLAACSKEDANNMDIADNGKVVYSVDLSSLPEIELSNPTFYNLNGDKENPLVTLKNNGVNTIRLRIWHHPKNNHSSFNEVKLFSEKLKQMGFKVWLTVHYSDTWADPGSQTLPLFWIGLPYEAVRDSVYAYTSKIVSEINPDFIQIGNEINSGFLFPFGNTNTEEDQFLELISSGVKAVRDYSNDIKIIIHFAGINGSDWFYSKLPNLDYDIIGISYYPIWHGKNLSMLESSIQSLGQKFNKEILIAETAYPFTLNWNDWTNNIVGLEEHLILPDYPASAQGQRDFVARIKTLVSTNERCIGFCYWGAELIAFKGPEATDGSSWENQALYGFDNRALPVINEFGN